MKHETKNVLVFCLKTIDTKVTPLLHISTILGYPDISDPATSFIGKQDFQMIDETLPQQQQHLSRYRPARQKSDIIVYKILETLQILKVGAMRLQLSFSFLAEGPPNCCHF